MKRHEGTLIVSVRPEIDLIFSDSALRQQNSSTLGVAFAISRLFIFKTESIFSHNP